MKDRPLCIELWLPEHRSKVWDVQVYLAGVVTLHSAVLVDNYVGSEICYVRY